MSDTSRALPPANWYPDPMGSAELRWWDGAAWTEQVTAKPVVAASVESDEVESAPRSRRELRDRGGALTY